MSVASASALVSRPGSTSFEPASAVVYGRPHAFAWKIGVAGNTESRREIPWESTVIDENECSTAER